MVVCGFFLYHFLRWDYYYMISQFHDLLVGSRLSNHSWCFNESMWTQTVLSLEERLEL